VYEIIFHRLAETELLESAHWYAERSSYAYQHFLQEIETCISFLKKTPKTFPIVYKNKRKINLRNFPFSIVYIVGNKEVLVLSVFHQSRNPEIWKKR